MAADDSDRMRRAYRVSGEVMREELRQERPDDARELDGVTPGEVVVVRGQYDRIEQVLEATQVPFQRTTPTQAGDLDWEVLYDGEIRGRGEKRIENSPRRRVSVSPCRDGGQCGLVCPDLIVNFLLCG